MGRWSRSIDLSWGEAGLFRLRFGAAFSRRWANELQRSVVCDAPAFNGTVVQIMILESAFSPVGGRTPELPCPLCANFQRRYGFS